MNLIDITIIKVKFRLTIWLTRNLGVDFFRLESLCIIRSKLDSFDLGQRGKLLLKTQSYRFELGT
jgi:hypothetical protein